MSATAETAPNLTPIKIDGITSIYLSGPMTRLPEFNYPAFHAAAAALRRAGYIVFNPAEGAAGGLVETAGLTGSESANEIGFDVRSAFADYARHITTDADAIAVLPGWENSRGARGEVALATAIGLPVIDAITGDQIDVEFSVRTLDPSAPVAPIAEVIEFKSKPGEVRTTSATGGQKGVKEVRYSLIPPGPLKELAVLYGRGAEKYAPDNWKRGYLWSYSYDALLRHLDLWWSRAEDHDEEMGVKHLINAAWHAFNLAWFMENRPEFDDRPNGVQGSGETYIGAQPTPQWIFDHRESQSD